MKQICFLNSRFFVCFTLTIRETAASIYISPKTEFYRQSKSKWFRVLTETVFLFRVLSSVKIKIEASILIFSILIEISSKNRGLHFDLDLDQNGKNKNDEVGILFFFLLLFWISSQREDTHFPILILIFDKTRSVKIKTLEIMDITEINICPINRMWTFSILILTDDKTRS